MTDSTMRWICAPCGVVGETAADAPTCDKCQATMTRPTVFDCARLGLLPELQQLIEQTPSFDVNALEPASNATLLHHAAINSKMRILEYLAREFRGVLQIDILGGVELQSTPLFWAAYHNHIYAVELLLREGADASFTDTSGFCAFLVAIQKCFPILAAYLVAKGTSINARVQDTGRRTALMLLCQRQRFHLDSFRMVLSLDADIEAQDADGNTALHHAALNDLGLAVKMLLDRGASPLVTNAEGLTALDIARQKLSDRSMARHLLEEDKQLQGLAKTTRLPKKWLEDNVYKLSFFVPWVVIPLIAWIIVTTNGWSLILIKEIGLLGLAFMVLKVLQRGSYGDKRKAAGLMFGINVASIFWLILGFVDLTNSVPLSTTFTVCLVVSASIMIYSLYKTAVTDAGTVFTTYDEKIHNIRTLVESKSPSATKLCLTCLHKRPLRAKHCAELNACIAKFDHYCPFVVNAVGAENHHYFLGFVLFAVVAISMELAVCWWFITAQSDVMWNHGVIAWLWSVVHFHPLVVCISALALLHDAWIGYLLAFHIYLAMAALTTNEVVKNENLQRAYSRGVIGNVVDFLHLYGEKPVDWKVLYTLDQYKEQIARADSKHKSS